MARKGKGDATKIPDRPGRTKAEELNPKGEIKPRPPEAAPVPGQIDPDLKDLLTFKLPGGLSLEPLVTIFGAGIAGLTAAQELVERGFLVQVVERRESLFEEGCCEVGGVAATQWAFLGDTALPYGPGRVRPHTRTAGTETTVFAPLVGAPFLPYRLYFDTVHFWGIWYGKDYDPDFKLVDRLTQTPPGEHRLEKVPNRDRVALLAAGIGSFVTANTGMPKPKVYVVGHSERTTTEDTARWQSEKWAAQVVDVLKNTRVPERPSLKLSDLVDFEPVGMGSLEPLGHNAFADGRARNNRVELHVAGVHVPGDHGYRFFPAFYRNLDDSMRRTPIYDERGVATSETTISRLKGTAEVAVATTDGRSPFLVPRRKAKSFDELRSLTKEMLEKFGYTTKDIALFQLQLFRLITMCEARRESELEACSWSDFICGGSAAASVGSCNRCGRPSRHHHHLPFSDAFVADLNKFPQAMAGMRATESDARTNGAITIQLMRDQFGDGEGVDRLLDGPTSTSWLAHWKSYLRRQGVRFYVGELKKLNWDATTRRLQPEVVGRRGGLELPPVGGVSAPVAEPGYSDEHAIGTIVGNPASDEYESNASYFMLAIPTDKLIGMLDSANLPPVVAPDKPTTLHQIRDYKSKIPGFPTRDAFAKDREGPPEPGGPFRDLTGVQLYFANDLHFAQGHVYHADSAWRLTSISQPQFWRQRGTVNNGYLGVLSIDIGEMHVGDTSMCSWTGIHLRDVASTLRRLIGRSPDSALEDLLHQVDAVARQATDLEYELQKFVGGLELSADPTQQPWAITKRLQTAFRDLLIRTYSPQGSPTVPSIVESLFKILSCLRPKVFLPFMPDPNDVTNLSKAIGASIGFPPTDLGGDHPVWKAWHKTLGGLTSICSALKVTDIERQAPHAFLALCWLFMVVLSPAAIPFAWQSTKLEIAQSVWRQILVSLRGHARVSVPEPLYFRIDDNIVFGRGAKGVELPSQNLTPYLVNLTGEFPNRPGVLPSEESDDRAFYDISFGQWLVMGGLMKTYTRITSMEHSNESARHAVRAILHNEVIKSSRSRHSTFPKYWSPEDHEFEELAFLRRIDSVLKEDEAPHLVDIMGLEEAVVRWMSGQGSEKPDNLGKLLSAVRSQAESDFAPWVGELERSGDPMRKIIEFLTRIGVRG